MEPPGTPARGRVPAAPVRPGPAAWTTHRPPRQRPRPARASGEGTGQVLGRREPPTPRGGTPGPGASRPPSRGAPTSGARWHRGGWGGGSRGREEGGGVGSVRPICSGPEGSPSATCSPGQPPAQAGVLGVTAASARQLLLPALLPTPGLREVRLCLPHRASALWRLLPWREDGLDQA